MKTPYRENYEIDDDPGRLDFDVLEGWLSKTYWSPGIRKDEIRRGAENSTVAVGCYAGAAQVGYMRLVSDKTRFAYVMDVYVAEPHRNRGIARAMIRFAMERPDLRDVYQWVLATQDAHAVYKGLGFEPLPNPERWMLWRREKIRK